MPILKTKLFDDGFVQEYGGIMEKNNSDVNAFWNKFCKVVVEQGVDEKYADRYVEWGQKQ